MEIGATTRALGEILLGLGQPELALESLGRAECLFRAERAEPSPGLASVLVLQGMAHQMLRDLQRARECMASASEQWAQLAVWAQHAAVEVLAADLDLEYGDSTRALERIDSVLPLIESKLRAGHPEWIKVAAVMGEGLRQQGQIGLATEMLEGARNQLEALAAPPAVLYRASNRTVHRSRALVGELVACHIEGRGCRRALDLIESFRESVWTGQAEQSDCYGKIRRSLNSGEAFASIQVSNGAATMIIVRPDSTEPIGLFLSVDRPTTSKLLLSFRNLSEDVQNALPYMDSLAALRELLLPKIGASLADVERLIVAADSLVARVPLVLVLSVPDVTFTPAGLTFASLRREAEPWSAENVQHVTMLCDPDLSRWNDWLGDEALPAELRLSLKSDLPLQPLAGARKECRAVRSLLDLRKIDVAAFVGANATLRNVERRLPSSSLLHLATHGVDGFRGRELWARLYVSPDTELGAAQQDLITLDRILHEWPRKLENLQLVTLPACESDSNVQVGASSFGLASGFIRAGCPRVIAARWPVDDAATAEFMERFYSNLFGLRATPTERRGRELLGPAAALREAKDWIRSRVDVHEPESERRGKIARVRSTAYSHPYYWAGFTLIGRPD